MIACVSVSLHASIVQHSGSHQENFHLPITQCMQHSERKLELNQQLHCTSQGVEAKSRTGM
uniref:Uncharacterized protein n=1 Tax=Arundo donax TaxID=35708 RepID=A0A0A8YA53_ARUDO